MTTAVDGRDKMIRISHLSVFMVLDDGEPCFMKGLAASTTKDG